MQLFYKRENSTSRNRVMDISSNINELKITDGQHKNNLSTLQETNIYPDYTSTSLFKVLYPFFMSMKLLGLFHNKKYHLEEIMCEGGSYKSKPIQCRSQLYPSQVYSFLISVLVVGNALRCLNALSMGLAIGPESFGRVMLIVWYLLCACNTIICFKASHQHCHLPSFFLLWDRIYNHDGNSYSLVISRKMTYIYTSVCWGVVVVNMVGSACVLYLTNTMETLLTPFTNDDPNINIVIAVYLFPHVYASAAWIFPMGFYFIICKILYDEFKRFNTGLSKMLHANTTKFPCEFEDMRQRHQQLCHLVSNADDMFSVYNAICIVLCVFDICLVMYNIIWYEQVRNNTLITVSCVFWMSCGAVNLALICVGAAFVNEQVNKCNGFSISLTCNKKKNIPFKQSEVISA